MSRCATHRLSTTTLRPERILANSAAELSPRPNTIIPPLGCGAQHEHQAPTQSKAHQLGTARWACVRAGKMSPDAEATFHRASCTLGNQVVRASDGSPFRQERRPNSSMPNSWGRSRSARRSKHTTSWVIVSLGGDRIVEHRRVQRAPPPPPLTAPPSHPRHGLPGPTKANPGTILQLGWRAD